jgi:hypothetical protein
VSPARCGRAGGFDRGPLEGEGGTAHISARLSLHAACSQALVISLIVMYAAFMGREIQ